MVDRFDCIIIGGGIAGLQAAIQLGRYKHRILVIDAGDGRSTLCRSYHNILGYPEGISGQALRKAGQEHANRLGVEFVHGTAAKIENTGAGEFLVRMEKINTAFQGRRLLFATGVLDRFPPFPELYPCLGISVYVCPDCDGYETSGKTTIVMGAGDAGANMALAITYWAEKVIYINHEGTPVSKQLLRKLTEKQIEMHEDRISSILADHSCFQGVQLKDGQRIYAEKGFLAFGGNLVRSQLAGELGVKLHHNRHILADSRTKMTNVKYVWAAGDIAAHSEQVTIAMGDGSQAAIWIHKSLVAD